MNTANRLQSHPKRLAVIGFSLGALVAVALGIWVRRNEPASAWEWHER